MNYSVTFTFFDEKFITVMVSESNIKRFIECLGKGEVYWDNKGGFWLQTEQVRYIQIDKKEDAIPDPIAY